MAIGYRDVSVWSENDLDRWCVGRRGGVKSFNNRCRCEHGNVVDGHDESANVFSSDIADARRSGVGDDAGDKTAFTDMTFCDLESKVGVFAADRRG